MLLGDYHFSSFINSYTNSKMRLNADYYIGDYDQCGREFLGKYLDSSFPEIGYDESMREELRTFFKQVKENGESRCAVVTSDRDDKPRFMDITGKYLPGENLCYELILFDIPDMEDDFVLFCNNMWKYRTMMGLSDHIYMDYDMTMDIVSCYRYVGKKSVRLFYGTFEEFDKSVRENAEHTDKNHVVIDRLIDELKGARNVIEVTIKTGFLNIDNKIQTLHIKGRFDDMNGHRNMYCVISNLTGAEEDLPFYMTSAGIDSMTGLLNKRSLIEYSEDVLRNPATASRKHYIVLLDIDDFKKINDNYGHQMGDKAISLLGRILSEVVGAQGIVGRFGGDEFYVLTDMVDTEDRLRVILRNIRGNAALRAKEELKINNLTLSLGVSTYPTDDNTFNGLFSLADKALYIAKEKGKNRYVIYRPELHSEVNTGIARKGFSSFGEQAKALNIVVSSLYVRGKESIEWALMLLVTAFDLDGIDIFCGEDMKLTYTAGKYESDFSADIFLNDEKYRQKIGENGLLVMNNYNNLKRIIPKVYEELNNRKCFAFIHQIFPDAEKPNLFINYYVKNHIHLWSEAEISNLSLFGALVNEVLKK